jgi:hypothetical protein
LTLGDVKQRLSDQIRLLARYEEAFMALMRDLTSRHALHLVAGTMPHVDGTGRLTNVSHVFGPDGRHGAQAPS